MSEITNPLQHKLRDGRLALGVGVRLARTVDIARAMHNAGYDWLFLDLEHGTIPLDVVAQMAYAALDVGIAPVVRVPQRDFNTATRALDNGALGIILPHIDSADEAREAVVRLKYPPQGHRSIGGTGAILGFRPDRIAQSADAINRATMIVVMLETPAAIANAEAIAAVPGIDVLMIGTNDLCAELGIPGASDHEQVRQAYATVVAACVKHGKWAGMGGVGPEAQIRAYVDMGVRFVFAGTDFPILMAAAAARSDRIRGSQGKQ